MERAIKEIWLLFWYNITVVLVQQKDTEKGLHCCSGTTKTAFYGACTVVLVHTFIDIYHIPQVFYLNNTTGEQSDGECPTIPKRNCDSHIGTGGKYSPERSGRMFEHWNRFVQKTTERLNATAQESRCRERSKPKQDEATLKQSEATLKQTKAK